MEKGSLDWLQQSTGLELDPLVDVTQHLAAGDPAGTFAVAPDHGRAETGEDATGEQALPAEAAEPAPADGMVPAPVLAVVEVVASASAPAATGAEYGIAVADVPAAVPASGTHGAAVADVLAAGAAASAAGGSEPVADEGAIDAAGALVTGQPATLDDGGRIEGDWSGEVIIGDMPGDDSGAGTYDYSWSSTFSASVGDINGDGFGDTLVASYEYAGGSYSFGSWIVFGSAEGGDTGIGPASLDGTNGFTLLAGGGDVQGWAVSGAGDVNGDGFDDLLVGTYSYDPDGNYVTTNYLVYGAADGFAATVEIENGTVVAADDGYADGGGYDYSWSWSNSSSLGDVNGDGFDDALVATYGADAQGNYSFASYVVFGGADGTDAQIDPATLDGTNGFRLLADGGEVYGWTVSGAGDVNGDGFDDITVATYSYDPDGNYAAVTYLIYGAADGFASSVDVASLDGTNGTVVQGDLDHAGSGYYGGTYYCWAATTVNGDGFADAPAARYGNPAPGDYSSGYLVFGLEALAPANWV